jgi:hypothetical protein
MPWVEFEPTIQSASHIDCVWLDNNFSLVLWAFFKAVTSSATETKTVNHETYQGLTSGEEGWRKATCPFTGHRLNYDYSSPSSSSLLKMCHHSLTLVSLFVSKFSDYNPYVRIDMDFCQFLRTAVLYTTWSGAHRVHPDVTTLIIEFRHIETYAGCFKTCFTHLKAYVHFFRGHVQCFELL